MHLQGRKPATGQGGFMLVVVPVVIGAVLLMGLQMVNRSRKAMRSSSADLNHLQTRLCAQRCATLSANRIQKTLEDNQPLQSHEVACGCQKAEGEPLDCSVKASDPGEKIYRDCYGLTVHSTEVGLESQCSGDREFSSDLEMDVAYRETPLFQFAVFYEGFLTIAPAPPMVLQGRVHSNDTVRLEPRRYLAIEDWVTSPKGVVADLREEPPPDIHFARMDGTLESVPVQPTALEPIALDRVIPGFGAWKPAHRVAYGGQPNGCGPVQAFRLPIRGLSDPAELIDWRAPGDDASRKRSKFSHKAGLIFKGEWLNNGLGPVAFAADPIRPPASPSGWRTEAVAGRTRVLFWDARDRLHVKLLPVDVSLLQARSPSDSLVYLHDELRDPGQGGAIVGGFLLHNGARLLRPLTIVTNSRMFLLGDYNSDSAFAWDGARFPWPAALVSDNFTQLSNDVIPSEHDGSHEYGSRIRDRNPAARTTVNTCLLTGIVRGPDGRDPGGFENMSRYLEDWTGTPYARSGSTACLWESRQSRGDYRGYSDVYRAPLREFTFSRMYRSVSNMPPGTPRLVVPGLQDLEVVRN